MSWWVATMALLYAVSGITVVKSDELAVIRRWGRLVGDTPALQEHGPGLLFALPRPVDEVVRVQARHVYEVPVSTLANTGDAGEDPLAANTIDPLKQGYALTGDQNIVHVDMVARYRIQNPALWAFYGPKADDVLRVEITAAMVRSLGEMTVDRVLADGRKELIATATRRAQDGLDAASSGLELSSLELTRLIPPRALATEFDAVQSAYIDAETRKKQAQAFAEQVVPKAQAGVDAALQAARGDADTALASARGEAQTFLSLAKEYRSNPQVVRERLYRESIELALHDAGKIEWVPPPIGGRYQGVRVTIEPKISQPPKAGRDED
jgi:membrane protease subunit HflK